MFFPGDPLNYPPNSLSSVRRYESDRAPTNLDLKNFNLGDEWLDTSTSDWYKLASKANGSADWCNICASESGDPIDFLQTDDGAPAVGPNGSGITDLIGGTGIVTSGQDPGTAVTIAVDGSTVTTQYDTDSGSATPTAGVLDVLGGTGLNTVGAGNDVTINLDTPVLVTNGGTGVATLNDNAVLIGAGTGGMESTGPGTVGQLLVGVTGSPPIFSNSSDGNFSFTKTTSGTRQLSVSNDEDSNPGSKAVLRIAMGGIAGGLPYLSIEKTGTRFWATGMANLANEDLVTRSNPTVATPATGTECIRMTPDGEVTKVNQPAFSARLATTVLNVTGDGGAGYQLGDTDVGVALTLIFDQSGDLTLGASGGAFFTAPVSGRYYLSSRASVLECLGADEIAGVLSTSNRSYGQFQGPNLTSSDGCFQDSNFLADIDAADTVTAGVTVFGVGADTSDVQGSTSLRTGFSGVLIC